MKTVLERLLTVLADDPLAPKRIRVRNAMQVVSYDKACEIVGTANVKTATEFKVWIRTNKVGVPSNPNEVYSADWESWPKFLTGLSKKRFVPYEEASRIVREMKLTQNGFRAWIKTHKGLGVPSNPNATYAGKGWKDWSAFLTGMSKVRWIPYEKACRIVRTAGLRTGDEFKAWVKKQKRLGVPSAPFNVYSEWKSWPEFLGNGNSPHQKSASLVSYAEASRTVRAAGIKTVTEFKLWVKTHKVGVPVCPDSAYDEWKSWPEFLTGRYRTWVSYEEACKIVHDADIKTGTEFGAWVKSNKSSSVPSNPHKSYCGKGWVNWSEFLAGKKSCKAA